MNRVSVESLGSYTVEVSDGTGEVTLTVVHGVDPVASVRLLRREARLLAAALLNLSEELAK